jgi:hypothetical protein
MDLLLRQTSPTVRLAGGGGPVSRPQLMTANSK